MAKRVPLKRPSAPVRTPPDLPTEFRSIAADEFVDDAVLDESRAEGCDLQSRTIRGLTARFSMFERVLLSGCTLPSLRLRDVRFVQADLSNAILRGSELTRVEFTDCRLTGMKAIECRWKHVLIDNCDAHYAQFNDSVLIDCEISSTQLVEADLRGCDLAGSQLRRTSLQRTDCTGTRLKHLDLRTSDIEGLIVRPEDVTGAIVSPAQAIELARLLGLLVR